MLVTISGASVLVFAALVRRSVAAGVVATAREDDGGRHQGGTKQGCDDPFHKVVSLNVEFFGLRPAEGGAYVPPNDCIGRFAHRALSERRIVRGIFGGTNPKDTHKIQCHIGSMNSVGDQRYPIPALRDKSLHRVWRKFGVAAIASTHLLFHEAKRVTPPGIV